MSEDAQPPDLSKTADIPLDGLTLPILGETDVHSEVQIEGDTEPKRTETLSSLFQSATPTNLAGGDNHRSDEIGFPTSDQRSDQGGEIDPILTRSVRLTEHAEPPRKPEGGEAGTLRALWAESHDRGVPLYRRQGPMAGIGLCLLLTIGAISFPWTRATIESGVVILTDGAEDAAVPRGTSSGNRSDPLDGPASGSLIQGSKSAKSNAIDSTSGSAADVVGNDNVIAGPSKTAIERTPTETTKAPTPVASPNPSPDPDPSDVQTPEATAPDLTEAPVVIAPVQLACEDPAAIPPLCVPVEVPVVPTDTTPIVEPSTTTIPPPTDPPVVTTDAPTTTEAPTTTTTVKATTTTRRRRTTTTTTTTTAPTTTPATAPATTTTTTTTAPTTTSTTTSTTAPTTTTTTTTTAPTTTPTTTSTTAPTTTTTTTVSSSIPDNSPPPDEDGGTTPIFVLCGPNADPSVTPPLPDINCD